MDADYDFAMSTTIEASVLDQSTDLRSFLKKLRKRVDPGTETLGAYKRLSQKRGRAVSQEEMAEAIGVSRTWYALLESGASVQPSVPLLNRVADALGASPDERNALFRLAIPALDRGLAREAQQTFESLSLVRTTSNRLRSANSNDDALAIAAECAANWFDDALLIVSAKRTESGSWNWSVGLNRGVVPNERFAPQLSDLPYLQERITSSNGFDGFIHVRHAIGHVYSQIDCEVLAAIADLASLALAGSSSGCRCA